MLQAFKARMKAAAYGDRDGTDDQGAGAGVRRRLLKHLARSQLDVRGAEECVCWNQLHTGPSPFFRPPVPLTVVVCSTAKDVEQCVRIAVHCGVKVSAKSGGHHVSWLAVPQGGICLDLSPMKAVHVDAAAQTAVVQPGATSSQLAQELLRRQLYVPLPPHPSAGVAGFVLMGGLGFCSSHYGAACDNLLAAEVVDPATGKLRWVDDSSEPHLMCGLRGAGPFLAIVTQLRLRLQPISPRLPCCMSYWHFQAATEVFANWAHQLQQLQEDGLSRDIESSLLLVASPGAPPTVQVSSTALDNTDEVRGRLGHLAGAAPLARMAHQQALVPALVAVQVAGQNWARAAPACYCQDTLVPHVSADMFQRVVAAFLQDNAPPTAIVTISRTPPAAAQPPTSFGFRAQFSICVQVIWQRTEQGAAGDNDLPQMRWVEALRQSVAEQAGRELLGVGCNPYLCMMQAGHRNFGQCYEPAHWAALQRLKSQHDPQGLLLPTSDQLAAGGPKV